MCQFFWIFQINLRFDFIIDENLVVDDFRCPENGRATDDEKSRGRNGCRKNEKKTHNKLMHKKFCSLESTHWVCETRKSGFFFHFPSAESAKIE